MEHNHNRKVGTIVKGSVDWSIEKSRRRLSS